MSEVKIAYTLTGVTKNRFRYEETDENENLVGTGDAVIGPIYVKKTVFRGAPPQILTVALTFA